VAESCSSLMVKKPENRPGKRSYFSYLKLGGDWRREYGANSPAGAMKQRNINPIDSLSGLLGGWLLTGAKGGNLIMSATTRNKKRGDSQKRKVLYQPGECGGREDVFSFWREHVLSLGGPHTKASGLKRFLHCKNRRPLQSNWGSRGCQGRKGGGVLPRKRGDCVVDGGSCSGPDRERSLNVSNR